LISAILMKINDTLEQFFHFKNPNYLLAFAIKPINQIYPYRNQSH
jgi:hypothetical protein